MAYKGWMTEDFEKLQNIGKALHLSPDQSKVFAYIAMGVTNSKEIADKMGLKDSPNGTKQSKATSKIARTCNKLHIIDDVQRNEKIQQLGLEFMKYYDLIEPMVKGDTYQMLEALEKLDGETER